MTFSSESLPELLSVYYKRLFPYGPFHRWLSFGNVNPKTYCNREMSFTLEGDTYVRFLSFDSPEEFEQELQRKCPQKIDIGAVYNVKPRMKRVSTSFDVEEQELVFDIDMTDYDTVRSCCSEANVCKKCWKLMTIATTILDTALRDDFGFKHLLWVFSGRRGVHCWVCDDLARKLDTKVRSDVAEYLQLLTAPDINGKLAHINSEFMHPSIKRAVDIIDKVFVTMAVEEQDMLGSVKGMKGVLALLGDERTLRREVEEAWERVPPTSASRWEALVNAHASLLAKGVLKRRSKYLIEEIKLQYAYPRLDIQVSKTPGHLLKAPFCIHPKTGKICVPFSPSSSVRFDPETVPTISEIVEEIHKFDAKEAETGDGKRRVKDYKKTSMYKGVQLFEEFVRKLEETWKAKRPKLEEPMDF